MKGLKAIRLQYAVGVVLISSINYSTIYYILYTTIYYKTYKTRVSIIFQCVN